MLSGIRGAASTWLGKAVLFVLFGLLIISFAVWGIGDIFRGGSVTSVATVGRTEIGIEAYRRAFQQRVYELQQRSRGFTTEQARMIGIDRQVLNQMIGETALNEEARRLGLAVSVEETARQLAANQVFRGVDGRFNRQAFDGYLRETGLSEAAFLQQQQQATLRQQLGEALSGGFASPLAMVEMLHRYRAEERTMSYVVVPGAIATALAPPTEDQLKALHEQRKSAFRAPEYRKFSALVLSPAEFAADVTVSDAELRQAYQRGLASGRFGAPEKRSVQQIVFPDRTAAAAAADRLAGGLAWDALLEELKLKPADVDLGLRTRGEFADAAIGEAAFGLTQGAISAPVQGPFGFVLLRLASIEPGAAQPFDALRDALAADVRAGKLASDRETRRKIDAVYDRIEELRSSGQTLQQVSAELKRDLVSVETDAEGRDKTGAPVSGVPETADVVKAVFASDRGVDNEVIRTRDNGFVWFEIEAIEQARERTFEEVRSQVEQLWRTDEAARLTTENANAHLARAEAGETLETIAAELGGAVETAEGVTRNGGDAIGPSAAATAFSLRTGQFAVAATGRGADRMILKLDAINVPAFDTENASIKGLRTQLDTTLSNEILNQYVAKSQAALGVAVNERALAQATGAQPSR